MHSHPTWRVSKCLKIWKSKMADILKIEKNVISLMSDFDKKNLHGGVVSYNS